MDKTAPDGSGNFLDWSFDGATAVFMVLLPVSRRRKA
jgi:hypothetical protein